MINNLLYFLYSHFFLIITFYFFFVGDILISINGQIVKNQLFNQQIELIKISCRPITLGFVPDRFK
jgi:hypothetical protein